MLGRFVLIHIILFDIIRPETLKFGGGNAFVEQLFLIIFFRLLGDRVMFMRREKGAIGVVFGGQGLLFLILFVGMLQS